MHSGTGQPAHAPASPSLEEGFETLTFNIVQAASTGLAPSEERDEVFAIIDI